MQRNLYKLEFNSPFGTYTIVSFNENILGIWLFNQKFFGGRFDISSIETKETNSLKLAKNWLTEYFEGKNPSISNLPLCFEGSEFQKEVFKILLKIPYGKLVRYGDISKKLAKIRGLKKMSSRAVGAAIGKNPISIVVPCHRVIGSKGKLTGYSGGIETKSNLLKLEGIDLNNYKSYLFEI